MYRIARLLVRARRAARRCVGGACYGALVALTGAYGLLSLVTVTVATTLFACLCWLVSRD